MAEGTSPSENSPPPPPPPAADPQQQEQNDGRGDQPPAPKPAAEPAPAASRPPPAKAVPDGPQERKARDFMEQAERKIRSSQSFFGGLFGKAAKLEEAADLYIRAANSFKVAKRTRAAGDAFKKAAELHLQLETKHEAASNYTEAAQVMKRDEPRDAVDCYLRAVEIYTDMGRFSLAAKYHSNVAEIYETELQEYDNAIANYEQSADFHRGEDSVSASNKCLVKVATLSSNMQQFQKGADIFEQIGRSSLENTLLKYGAKDYFFKAALCKFCISSEEAKDAIETYRGVHPGFDGTRELKLLQDLLVAYEDEDTDKFADIVKDYDSISRIDPFLTGLLLHIKKAINKEPDIN